MKSSSCFKTAILTIVPGLLILCALLLAIPRLDAAICIPRAAKKIGVEPTYTAIYGYIDRSITPGMTRDQALSALEKIGPVRVSFTTQTPERNIVSDQASIDICVDPFNNIRLFINYRSDTQQITSISIEGD